MANKFEIYRFDNCPTKRWLQDQIYSHLSKRIKSNIMIVGSPSVEPQITNGFKIASTPKANIYLVEKNAKRFYEMSRRCHVLKGIPEGPRYDTPEGWPENWYSRVIRLYTSVAAYEEAASLNQPVRFEDLDMCQTMVSIEPLVRYRLALQSRIGGYSAKLRKCMLITSALRHCDLETTLDTISNILVDTLGISIGMWSSASGAKHSRLYKEHGVKEYSPYISDHGRVLKNGLHLFSYADKAPMFSCIILYV